MSCGAFGGSGACGGGGGGAGGVPPIGGNQMPRRCTDRGFFDPFCMPMEKQRFEQSCYFNPFVHAQCLGVDMNMQGFRNDILKCQEDYKKAVWAVLKKYAVGEGEKGDNVNNFAGMTNGNNMFRELNRTNFFNNLNLNVSNMKRSSSIPVDPSGFQFGDPRNQRNRRSMPSGRLMQT